MKRICLLVLVIMAVTAVPFVHGQTLTYYGAHVTDQPPWINKIVVYNNGGQDADFQITVWDADGQVALQEEYTAPANNSKVLVMSNFVGYVFGPGEVELVPVEGTLVIETESEKIRPKLSFRYGDSESLTEFFLQDTLAWEYILPNTIQGHFSWTGIALMNPYDNPLTVMLKAYQDGELQGQNEEDVPANTKYVRLSDGIWPGLLYTDFDQVKIVSTDKEFPPPMTITGNDAQDRHVFFNGAVTATVRPMGAGDLYATDTIVGDLYYVPAGIFQQGRGLGDPCDYETPFTHTLTRNLAVMETEVTQGMWDALDAMQPDLPGNPSYFIGLERPVEKVTWYEAVLFANLLSVEQGLMPCYYKDASFTTLVVNGNHTSGSFYCDWDANGYRLPTEGEWEYFCRAGTTTPFSVDEPNFTSCGSYCSAGDLPNLESVAWFCANRNDHAENNTTKPVGLKEANPWGLRDVHGNVREWCWDWWSSYPSGSETDYDGPGSGSARVRRGGYWDSYARYCRSAHRSYVSPGYRSFRLGFRLLRSSY